jgi:hypothetical protein
VNLGSEAYIIFLFTFFVARLWIWGSACLEKVLATAKQRFKASRGDVYLAEGEFREIYLNLESEWIDKRWPSTVVS